MQPTLSRGSQGENVRALQQALSRAGHATPIDGYFGPDTVRAVRDLQARQRLEQDGVAGPLTWQALENVLGMSVATTGAPSARATSPGAEEPGEGTQEGMSTKAKVVTGLVGAGAVAWAGWALHRWWKSAQAK